MRWFKAGFRQQTLVDLPPSFQELIAKLSNQSLSWQTCASAAHFLQPQRLKQVARFIVQVGALLAYFLFIRAISTMIGNSLLFSKSLEIKCNGSFSIICMALILPDAFRLSTFTYIM